MRTLSYPKFRLTHDEQEDLLTESLPWSEAVSVVEPPVIPECRDPADRAFLRLALVGKADGLVTGDDDLITLAPEFAVPILDPASLRARLLSTSRSQ